MAVYEADEWPRWRDVFRKAELKQHDTHAEWLAASGVAVARLQAQGFIIHRQVVTIDLNRGECTKTVPVTVVKSGNDWIVNQIDLNLAGTPQRPCDPSVPEEPKQ